VSLDRNIDTEVESEKELCSAGVQVDRQRHLILDGSSDSISFQSARTAFRYRYVTLDSIQVNQLNPCRHVQVFSAASNPSNQCLVQKLGHREEGQEVRGQA